MMGKELKLEIARSPVCPHCRLDTFDDWTHAKTIRYGTGITRLEGSLKCHGCWKFFSITQYLDGEMHSTAWTTTPKRGLSPQQDNE